MEPKKTTSSAASYSAQYKDPRWQKKRLEIMQRDGFKCCRCGTQEVTLNVHHLFYEKGCAIWEYDDYCFVTMCEECHKTLHNDLDDVQLAMRDFSRNTATNKGIQLDRLYSFLMSISRLESSAAIKAIDSIETIMYLISEERRNGYYDRCMEEEK